MLCCFYDFFLLVVNRSMRTIKGELIPYLVKKQFQKPKKPKEFVLEYDVGLTGAPECEDRKAGNYTTIHYFVQHLE